MGVHLGVLGFFPTLFCTPGGMRMRLPSLVLARTFASLLLWLWAQGYGCGITNGLVIFQHLMNDVFDEYFDDFVVSYINGIFIFSKNMEDHKHHVRLYAWFWRTSWKLNFMPNWNSVNSINLKCNFWVTSLEMTLTWIFIKFRPFLTGLLQLLFEIFDVFLDLPIFINFSLRNIF